MRETFNVLTLDGGGSKGIYSLGILYEIEAKLKSPLVNHFEMFYETSTGAIIAMLLAKGKTVEYIKDLYLGKIPSMMAHLFPFQRSRALKKVLIDEFQNDTFNSIPKQIGIVSTSLDERKVKIFKSSGSTAQGRKESFKPAWGFTIVDALMASCAATPFFDKVNLENQKEGINFSLMDGGFSANNPTLFALIDAVRALKIQRDKLRVLNIGTGDFPYCVNPQMICSGFEHILSRNLISEILDVSSNTTGLITQFLLEDIKILRISDSFTQPSLKTNLLENNKIKLAKMFDQGKASFGKKEADFDKYFLEA